MNDYIAVELSQIREQIKYLRRLADNSKNPISAGILDSIASDLDRSANTIETELKKVPRETKPAN